MCVTDSWAHDSASDFVLKIGCDKNVASSEIFSIALGSQAWLV
jgi:hypothetical protein